VWLAVSVAPAPAAREAAPGYANSLIADTALNYNGQWGGQACADAHHSGLTGSTRVYPAYPSGYTSAPSAGVHIDPNAGGDGQCRSFVNCVVALASGRTQWIGGTPDGTYFGAFLKAGGTEIKSIDKLVKGDIVQIGNGTHTFIVVDRITGSKFDVVDSNENYDEYVSEHAQTITLSSTERAFRMGGAEAPAAGPQPQEQASSGIVTAKLYYTKLDDYDATNVRLQILRSGKVVVDHAFPSADLAAWVPGSGSTRGSLLVRDVDHDGQPEVGVELYPGGAHHESWSVVYRYDKRAGKYLSSQHTWGDPSYTLVQMDKDQIPEWLTADIRFQGEFACSGCSPLPVQIFDFHAGSFQDVSRRFQSRISADAARWWKLYVSEHGATTPGVGITNVRGDLAAWAADEERLGKHQTVVSALQDAERRGYLQVDPMEQSVLGSPATFIQNLFRFLRTTGYMSR
jgi:hypothetical protein